MRRCIRIGTGGGLKILWPSGRVGSTPTTATRYNTGHRASGYDVHGHAWLCDTYTT